MTCSRSGPKIDMSEEPLVQMTTHRFDGPPSKPADTGSVNSTTVVAPRETVCSIRQGLCAGAFALDRARRSASVPRGDMKLSSTTDTIAPSSHFHTIPCEPINPSYPSYGITPQASQQDCGVYLCREFESPASRPSRSTRRPGGNALRIFDPQIGAPPMTKARVRTVTRRIISPGTFIPIDPR